MRRKVYKRDFEEEAELSKFTYDHSYRVFLNGKKALNVRGPTIVSYEEFYRYTDKLTTEIVYKYIDHMKEDHYNIKTNLQKLLNYLPKQLMNESVYQRLPIPFWRRNSVLNTM